MKLVDGYYVGNDFFNVLHVQRGIQLPAEHCSVIIDNIDDQAFVIRLPRPEDAVGLFYSIIVLPNPVPIGIGEELDVTVKDGKGNALVTLDTWAEHALLWSDGYYFHNFATI